MHRDTLNASGIQPIDLDCGMPDKDDDDERWNVCFVFEIKKPNLQSYINRLILKIQNNRYEKSNHVAKINKSIE